MRTKASACIISDEIAAKSLAGKNAPAENAAEKEILRLKEVIAGHDREEQHLRGVITRLEGDLERNRDLRQRLENERDAAKKESERIMEVLRIAGSIAGNKTEERGHWGALGMGPWYR